MNLQNSKIKGQSICARGVFSLQIHTPALILYWWFVMKKIPLSQGKFALVDDMDYDYLTQWKWSVDGNYASRCVDYNNKTKKILMHRQILGLPEGVMLDHKDRNGRNNQKSNLRICRHFENMLNKKVRNTSGYKGVTKDKRKKGDWWLSAIQINKRNGKKYRYHIITTESKEYAAQLYDIVAKIVNGEFAYLNFKNVYDYPTKYYYIAISKLDNAISTHKAEIEISLYQDIKKRMRLFLWELSIKGKHKRLCCLFGEKSFERLMFNKENG